MILFGNSLFGQAGISKHIHAWLVGFSANVLVYASVLYNAHSR